MSESMAKAIVVVDYENVYGGATKYGLKITVKGFQRIIEHLQEQFDIPDEDVLVVCNFPGYGDLKAEITGLGYTVVESLEKGDNMADGYVIAYGIHKLMLSADNIDRLIVMAGDGIYAGMIRLCVQEYKKPVTVVSWSKVLASHLEKVSTKLVDTQHIEDILDVRSNHESGVEQGWCLSNALQDIERNLIGFLLKSRNSNGFQVRALVRIMEKWTGPVMERFGGDFDKIRDFVMACTENGGFLEKSRQPGSHGQDEVWWVKLIPNHPKVVHVKNEKRPVR